MSDSILKHINGVFVYPSIVFSVNTQVSFTLGLSHLNYIIHIQKKKNVLTIHVYFALNYISS
jgi:hypothetical protein